MTKLWGGRFDTPTDKDVEAFTSSLGIDSRLWEADILVSSAHVRMLGRVGVLSETEARDICDGLAAVRDAIGRGEVTWDPGAEDIHSEIERLLGARIGALAGKLRTGRSRNDLVTTATRLYLRRQMLELHEDLRALQKALVAHAEGHVETVLPGLTHMQHAQPVSLAHHLLAYFWMLERDVGRLRDALARVGTLALGSAALAGTSFLIDRESVARELGFDAISENSLDAVSDRDYVVEFLSLASLVMTHLSRLAEELVLWSTPEYGFVTLSDAVTTGSSLMPQKKNPDVAELVRGRVGRVVGALMGALTTFKALPLSYNRDLQEDKFHLFEGLDTTRAAVRITTVMLGHATFHAARMGAAVEGDFSNATDLADYLVAKGVAFSEAHEITGRIVRHAIEMGSAIERLPAETLKRFHPALEADVLPKLAPLVVMAARRSAGGTAPQAVRDQLAKAKEIVC